MTLFDYIKEIEDIIFRSTDEDGIISDDVIEKLDALELAKEEKVDNCIKFYKSRKAMAEALKNEKIAIAKRQQIAENEAERMKEYLAFCLDGSKWESVAGKISYRNSKAVVIEDEDSIPMDFKIPTYKVDKSAVKFALDKGDNVIGAYIEERMNTIIK